VGSGRSERDRRPLPRLDTGVAHSARVWNCLQGGKDNFAADRDAAETIMRIFPGMVHVARVERRFLARAVRYLAREAGIRQFLDIGTGLPITDHTQQIAQRIARQSRTVYVDNDPMVLVHARALLTSAPGGVTGYVEADVRDTEEILDQAAETLDFGQPVAVMMLGILGQIPDSADPGRVVTRLLDPLPPGSHLAISDGTDTSPAQNEAIAAYNLKASNPYHLRSPEQIAGFFEGLTLVPPGIVAISRWQPDLTAASTEPREVNALCGVGRKD
jgi:hypothetical protein